MRLLWVVMLLLLNVTEVIAQDELDFEAVFTTADGSFQFRYPADWTATENLDGYVTVAGGDITLSVLPPNALLNLELTASSAEAITNEFIALAGELFIPDESIEVEAGLLTPFTSEEAGFASITAAFILVVDIGDNFALVMALGDGLDFDELEPFVFAVVATFETGEFAQPGDVTGDLPILTHFNDGDLSGTWEAAIDELETLEFIPEDGDLLFEEEVLFSGLEAGLAIRDEAASDYTDFVMAGLVSFRPVDDEASVCGLLTRITTDTAGNLQDYLLVGNTSNDTILVLDKGANQDEPRVLEVESEVGFHDPQHILYIVRDDLLTVFINGQAVIEAWPVQQALVETDVEKQNVKAATNLDPGCVMTSVWVYGLPSDN